VATLAALSLLAAFGVGAAKAAGNPNAQFEFSICQTTVPQYDEEGNVIGELPALELLYAWSGAYVDTVAGSWTRTDGEPVLFGLSDSDFAAARSGSVDAGALTIQSDPGFDGLVGTFAIRRHVVATQTIAEPGGGWETVAACP
jgi:hypothetical protein